MLPSQQGIKIWIGFHEPSVKIGIGNIFWALRTYERVRLCVLTEGSKSHEVGLGKVPSRKG